MFKSGKIKKLSFFKVLLSKRIFSFKLKLLFVMIVVVNSVLVYFLFEADGITLGDDDSAILSRHKIRNTNTIFVQNKNLKYTTAKDLVIEIKQPIIKWKSEVFRSCENKFIGYSNLFAALQDVQIDPTKVRNANTFTTEKDLETEENKGFIELQFGFFRQKCKIKPDYMFRPKDRLTEWLKILNISKENITTKNSSSVFTIAITRYEYANLYHTMTDLFNIFLLSVLFRKKIKNISIIFVDEHPNNDLDEIWKTLFRDAYQVGNLQQEVTFKTLVWGITGYLSPLNQPKLTQVLYLDEFRNILLSSFNISDTKILNCRNISILFIFRRDYEIYPGNTKHASRKISNELELVERLREKFPSHTVQGIQLDKIPMQKQLQLVSKTDILIGMHGAGLTHALFLPDISGVIEIFPNYWSIANGHYRAISKWRGLHYVVWQNLRKDNELGGDFTRIPTRIMLKLTNQMIKKLCN